jgi:GNAT superfamily N-acetyltransferase
LQVVDYYKKVINPNVYVPQIFELRLANDLSEHELANFSAARHREYQNYISDKSFHGNFIFFDENEYEAFTPEYWVFEKDIQSKGGKVLAFYFNDKIGNGGFTLIEPKTPVSNMPINKEDVLQNMSKSELIDLITKTLKETLHDYLHLTSKDIDALSASSLSMCSEYPKISTDTDKSENAPDYENMTIHELIRKDIVKLKMHGTTFDHAANYGLNSKNPLFIEHFSIDESVRLKGIGKKILDFIDDYAIRYGHDVIFGHIYNDASFSKDDRKTTVSDVVLIKKWLYRHGYKTYMRNNDFYKKVKSVKKIDTTKTMLVIKEETVWVTAEYLSAIYNCSIQAIYERAKNHGLPHRKLGKKKTLYEFDLKKAERYFKKYPLIKHEKYRP